MRLCGSEVCFVHGSFSLQKQVYSCLCSGVKTNLDENSDSSSSSSDVAAWFVAAVLVVDFFIDLARARRLMCSVFCFFKDLVAMRRRPASSSVFWNSGKWRSTFFKSSRPMW